MTFLSSNVTLNDFINIHLQDVVENVINLSSGQAKKARQVLNQEFPAFSGESTEWFSFMSRFSESLWVHRSEKPQSLI